MTRAPRDELILVAAEFVRTELGVRFVKALEAVVEDHKEKLVFAPAEHLNYAQGVARQGTVMLRDMREAPEKAVAIIAAEEAKKLKDNKP